MNKLENTTSSTGCKYDTGKLRWDLLPLDLIEEIVRVYTAGASKYGDNNWKSLENGYDRYKAAMFRHLLEYEKGNIYDQDTGCKHLAQVAWNAIAMLYFSEDVNRRQEILPWSYMTDIISNIEGHFEPVGEKESVEAETCNKDSRSCN